MSKLAVRWCGSSSVRYALERKHPEPTHHHFHRPVTAQALLYAP